MKDQLRRFAAVTAILWFAFGVGGPAEAGSILTTRWGSAPENNSVSSSSPRERADGSNTGIGLYNNFVNTQAGGATYNGSTIQWTAIASTEATSAINNILGTQQAPVYLPDGTEVTCPLTPSGYGPEILRIPLTNSLTGK